MIDDHATTLRNEAVLVWQNLLYTSDLAAIQADFYSAGMIGGRCQDVLYNTGGSLAGSLICL